MTQSGNQPKPEDKQADDKTKRIARMKKEANSTSELADLLAKGIPGQGGMSVDVFKQKWIPNFEKGYTNLTPDAGDDKQPYGDDYAKRPRVRILSEGQPNTNT